MGLNLNKTRIDADLLTKGVIWGLKVLQDGRLEANPTADIPADDGWVRVAPPGVLYQRALLAARSDPHVEKVTHPDELEAAVRAYALVHGNVIVDWGNLTIGSEPVPFTKDNAFRILSSLEWSNLRSLIEQAAETRRALLKKEDDAVVGKSESESEPPLPPPALARVPNS